MRALPAIIAMVGCASAPMTREDWTLQGTLAGEAMIDYGQTRNILADNAESNPFVGSRGQYMDSTLFGVIAVSGEFLIARALPPKWRRAWEYFWVGAEGFNVYGNFLSGFYPW